MPSCYLHLWARMYRNVHQSCLTAIVKCVQASRTGERDRTDGERRVFTNNLNLGQETGNFLLLSLTWWRGMLFWTADIRGVTQPSRSVSLSLGMRPWAMGVVLCPRLKGYTQY